MSKISRFIFGAYTLYIPCEKVKDSLNILIVNNIPFGKTKEKDGAISVCLTPNGYKQYLSICGGSFRFGEKASALGFFALLRRYHLRLGMFIGMALFAFLLTVSSFFVWDINVYGNSTITTDEILEKLEEHGFHIGAFIPGADTDEICGRILLESGNISFLKINMRGTVASVEIRERRDDSVSGNISSPSNLVSKYDAQIERLEVLGGMPEVSYLQTVKKGELLVSGIIDSSALGYRTVRSRGKVYARVTLTFESEIPYDTTEKTYTGKEITQKSVKIFSKNINLSKNINIPYEKYDTIINKEKLYLFGIIELPIFVTTITYAEYEDAHRTLTENEALKLALEEINGRCDTEIPDAEILSRKTEVLGKSDSICVKTEIYCIIDIAEEVKIKTD